MTRFPLSVILAVVFASSVFAQPVITADQSGSNAEKFTRLLNRSEDWLGADGIYSIPLDGNDRWGSADKKTNTLFVFSDTMLGTADPETQKYRDVKMVNHSAAILTDYEPTQKQSGSMQFVYGKQGDGSRANIFEKKYWLQDGIVIDKKLYLTGFLPGKNWKPTQIDLLTIPLSPSGTPDWQQVSVSERVPLLVENEQFSVLFGIGIFDHTSTDGFVYVYGYRDNLKTHVKHLVVARVKSESFGEMERWRFWDGNEWSQDNTVAFRDEATLAERVSTELSVTPIAKDTFLLVFVQDVMSSRVAYKVGNSPMGPFGETVVFYEAPEPKTMERGIYVYNAKAHPHLSEPGLLLISYNVNRLGSLPRNSNEYRPRFIELPMSAVSDEKNNENIQ